MTNKNLTILVVAAAVLGGAAVYLNRDAKSSAPKLNGKAVFGDLDISAIAKVEVGDKLSLSGSDKGWTVDTYQGYPADRERLTENLLKLKDLKVGQVVRGKKLDKTTSLVLRDATGRELANLPLGERHAKWGHGRYAQFNGETVLVSDALDAFDGDAKQWLQTKIVDEPWISFNSLADAKLTESDFGFKTGVVAKVTIAGNTNATITVGNAVKGGTDRYLKVGTEKWTYVVPFYSVEKFLPKPPPEPKKDEPKKSEPAKPKAK